MKGIHHLWIALLIAGCSSPRYTYFFDRHQALPKTEPQFAQRASSVDQDTPQPPSFDDLQLPATADRQRMTGAVFAKSPGHAVQRANVQTPTLVRVPESPLHGQTVSRMDPDLKRSFIFSIVGALALLVTGSSFLLVTGTLSLTIGVIFGIKWFLRHSD